MSHPLLRFDSRIPHYDAAPNPAGYAFIRPAANAMPIGQRSRQTHYHLGRTDRAKVSLPRVPGRNLTLCHWPCTAAIHTAVQHRRRLPMPWLMLQHIPCIVNHWSHVFVLFWSTASIAVTLNEADDSATEDAVTSIPPFGSIVTRRVPARQPPWHCYPAGTRV